MLNDFILFCLGKNLDIYVLQCYFFLSNIIIKIVIIVLIYLQKCHGFYVKTHQSVFVFPRSLAFYNISDISSFVLCIIFRIKKLSLQ